jgi:Uncharacterized protein conserved in bacteria C-term(DUF2220)
MTIPSLEDVVWAQLVLGPTVKRRRRNERVIDAFAVHGWITHASRQDEFTITDSGMLVAEKRLSEHWPAWREDLVSFTNLGVSPEDTGAWSLLRRAQANQISRNLTHINRRTLNAWERRHSKVAVGPRSKTLAEARITVDELTRLRLPPSSRILLQNGEILDCDRPMGILGEIAIPERGWESIKQIDTPNSKVIISIENKGAFVDFPSAPHATLLFLPGDNIAALQQIASRMSNQSLIHFGDLDTDGLQIYESLVGRGFAIRHFIPSYVEEYLITHALTCKTPWPRRDYSSLHPIFSKLATRSLWLEHEALVLDHRFEAELESVIQRTVEAG